jgi:ribonuclease E
MLIDATHPEETRVVVLRNGRVEEFDYESAARKLLRGNIYLAKVTRVEPSLQAAFVDYGGNRHGFLAFNEIHPDYYQIPMADRQALLDEEAAAEAEEEAAADARAERMARRRQRDGGSRSSAAHSDEQEGDAPAAPLDDSEEDGDHAHDDDHDHDDEGPTTVAASVSSSDDDVIVEEVSEPETAGGFEPETGDTPPSSRASASEEDSEADAADDEAPAASEANGETAESADTSEGGGVTQVAAPAAEAETVEQVGSEDALEELPSRPRRRPRSYKIQEVIKRRQVILVQVVKEERGNKGAALTTYLSLAGRYTVLMPNTARGGGISRKITNPQDRKRLKAIAAELEVPEGMGLIIRTAGAARTKQEIRRDFEYLLRLWESVRDLTLESTAPSLVYEEGNLIKRSIRDLYNKDVEEIVVAGEHAHKDAKDFMRMLMPSHAKNVVLHQDSEPLFTKHGIERQLNAMFSPYVTLKSGGYLVINQAEALVAIDVNSGKATREFSIEETALNTNLEASDEIARQLKLRDLAGLIVIDFIDMEEKRNNRAVERRLKDALRFDRARIQLGRISHFGLMEMSRQRLRSGVLEGSTSQCPHCQGTGIIRSTESVALAVLRGLEDALMAGARTSLVATTTTSVALYILNNKRQFINEMETRHGIFVAVQASDKLQGANFQIEKGQAAPQVARRPDRAAVNMDWGFEGETPEVVESDAGGYQEEADEPSSSFGESRQREDEGRDERGGGDGRRRRRRGRRGGGGERGGDRGGERHRDERRHSGQSNGHAHAFDGDDHAGHVHDDMDAPIEAGGAAGFDDDSSEGEGTGSRREAQGGEGRQGQRNEEGGGRRRRRGRRGGRRGRDRARQPGENGMNGEADLASGSSDDEGYDQPRDAEPSASEERAPARPARESRRSEAAAEAAPVREAVKESAAQAPAIERAAEEAPRPRRSRSSEASAPVEPKLERVVVSPDQASGSESSEESSEPARRGWWQRRLGG